MAVINKLGGGGVNFDVMDALLDRLENAVDVYTNYSITNTLTGCSNSNTSATIWSGQSYNATITANGGYSLSGATVSITMGGVDITSTAYNSGTGEISIPLVTGNIVNIISAVSSAQYLTFSSADSFTLETVEVTQSWDGTLEYSTDASNWSTWDGETTLSSALVNGDNVLYMRGTGNTYITGDIDTQYSWLFTGNSGIECSGNIENLLDYQTVANGQHPVMADYCYAYLFMNNNLTSAPELPALTLSESCYQAMFSSTSLVTAPSLPSTTLAVACYADMFNGCIALTTIPSLDATILEDYCYSSMFLGCSGVYISDTLVGDYQNAWRVPTTNTGTDATDSLIDMFTDTSGTFTSTPTINTTYYTSNAIINADGTITPAVIPE